MTIEQLIALLENKVSFTDAQCTAAEQRGDIAMVEQLSTEKVNTEATLDQLRSLL